jgi:hypothetical protein
LNRQIFQIPEQNGLYAFVAPVSAPQRAQAINIAKFLTVDSATLYKKSFGRFEELVMKVIILTSLSSIVIPAVF